MRGENVSAGPLESTGRAIVVLTLGALLTAVPCTRARADCTVRAHGQVVFVDESGQKKPLPHVRVKLMDQDSDLDEEMAHGFADEQGFYDLTGKGGETICSGTDCEKPDAYVKFILQRDDRLEVESPMWATRWAMTSVRVDRCGDWDMGQRVFSTEYPEDRAARLWAKTDEAYRLFEAHTDRRPEGNDGEVAVEIPTVLTAGTPYTTWDTIHWPGGRTVGDTVFHEFGHRLRHAADGGVDHFNRDAIEYWYPRDHDRDQRTNEGFAFNEGWADYTRAVFKNGRDTTAEASVGETSLKGDDVQGDVARRLARISNRCGGFRAMYGTLLAHPNANEGGIHSYSEFYDAFMADHPDCEKRLGQREIKIIRPIPWAGPPQSKKAYGGPGRPIPPADRPKFKLEGDWLATSPQARKLAADEMAAVGRHTSKLEVRTAPRMPSGLPAETQAVIGAFHGRRVSSRKSWVDDSSQAYRKLLLDGPRSNEASLADGSYERARQAARDELVTAIAAPRLGRIEEVRRAIAAEKAKAADPKLAAYLGALDARYARAESECRDALQSRGTGAHEVPLAILPSELGGRAIGASR